MWSVDPGIGGFVRQADHEGRCHIGSDPLANDGVRNLGHDHLHTGSHQFHGCWSGMLPGLVEVDNRASAPVAGHADRADTGRWHWIAPVGAQEEEEGMSSQCSCIGLRHDQGTERIGVDSPEGFGLALGGRLKHSQLGTR